MDRASPFRGDTPRRPVCVFQYSGEAGIALLAWIFHAGQPGRGGRLRSSLPVYGPHQPSGRRLRNLQFCSDASYRGKNHAEPLGFLHEASGLFVVLALDM